MDLSIAFAMLALGLAASVRCVAFRGRSSTHVLAGALAGSAGALGTAPGTRPGGSAVFGFGADGLAHAGGLGSGIRGGILCL